MWHMGDGWGWWMVMGWLWMLVFWGFVIWGVYILVTRLGGPAGRSQTTEPTALEILERRYARGELSHEEFEEMRHRLGGAVAAGSNGTPVQSNESEEVAAHREA